MKILITEFMEDKSVEMLKSNFDITVDTNLSVNHNQLKKIISNFDILIVRNKTQVNKEILENASSLKFIGRLGVGLDNIDTEYCKNNNIHVQSATGMNADSVAEYVINTALSLLKNIPLMHQETFIGNWPRTSISSRELKGKIFGLMGFGLIAKKVSAMAKIFNVQIIAYDPFIDHANWPDGPALKVGDLKSALGTAHCISLNLPKLTNPIIKEEEFLIMKEGMVIINTARGGLIDEKALINALETGKVAAAGLDVFDHEPPLLESPFAKFKQVVLSPHVAGLSSEAAEGMAISSIQNVLDYFDGNLESHFIVNK